MTDQIPTPRTDSHFIGRLKEGGRTDKRDERFARQLERENAVALRFLLGEVREGIGPVALRARDAYEEIRSIRRAFEEGK